MLRKRGNFLFFTNQNLVKDTKTLSASTSTAAAKKGLHVVLLRVKKRKKNSSTNTHSRAYSAGKICV
jgi:hypothetical protein